MKAFFETFIQHWFFTPNSQCPICGRILLHTNAYFCPECQKTLPFNRAHYCLKCGRPLIEAGNYCQNCGMYAYPFSGGFSLMHFDEQSKKVIYAIKFKGRPQLAIFLGQMMAKEMQSCAWIDHIDCIVPVPIHKKRLAERGYNQSAYLSEGLKIGLKKNVIVNKHLLIRILDTPHQIGMNREERCKNLQNAFAVEDQAKIVNKHILLVDDVNTTGSTLNHCAQTLLDEGAAGIFIATCCAVE